MKIKLNDKVGFDLPKLMSGKLLLQANSGGGKSWAIRRIVEQCYGKVPIFVLDTEGEFASLREKYEFILIGKGQDITVNPKAAAVLAHRLIEERQSVIVDLLEMTPYERETFVHNFIQAMTNAPKKLWLPTLVVIDEAQTYAPEGDKTECGRVIHDAAFKFRKRNFGILFATPRISVLSKNVISTCRNKLIGYTSFEGDVKRAAFELGFSSKEQMLELRDLDPGEFFAFGPAISKEVIRVRVGEVETSHGVEGKNITKVAPPTEKVRKALARLMDVPQEAEQKERTEAEMKKEISRLKAENTRLSKTQTPLIDSTAQVKRDREWQAKLDSANKEIQRLGGVLNKVSMIIGGDARTVAVISAPTKVVVTGGERRPLIGQGVESGREATLPDVPIKMEGDLSGPEQRILNSIAWLESIGNLSPEATAVAFLAGYTYGGGGFNNPKGSLRSRGFIAYEGRNLVLTSTGRSLAQIPDTPLTQEGLHEKVLSVLPGPEQRILRPLLEKYPEAVQNQDLAELSGYQFGSGGFNNPRGRLRTLGLIEYTHGGTRARSILFI